MSGETKTIAAIGIITLVVIIAGVLFLGKQKPKDQVQKIDEATMLADAKHTIGEATAQARIVEFADFQCPACATAHPILKKVLSENKDKVYFVFRHYPLSFHANAKTAAQACEAAAIQGKFWEMHDKIYENQSEWSEKSNAKEIFIKYAEDLKLDLTKFKDDFEKGKTDIENDYVLGNKAGVDSTPTFFVNGQKKPGVIQETELLDIINKASTSK